MRLDVMLDEVALRLEVYGPEHLLDVGVGFTGWHALGLLLKCKQRSFVIAAHFVPIGSRPLMFLDSQEEESNR